MQLFSSPKRNLKFKTIFSFKVINTKEIKSDSILINTIPSFESNSYEICLNDENIFDSKLKKIVCLETSKSKPTQIKRRVLQSNTQRNISMRILSSNQMFRHKKNHFNVGRWSEDEHKKFIQAIFLYGNDWKLVQKHIKTRSSTQSRSHSQKFFLKLKNFDVTELNNCELSISSLYSHAQKLGEEEKNRLISVLLSYEYSDIDYDIDYDYTTSNGNDINYYNSNTQNNYKNFKYIDCFSDVISRKRKIQREDEDSIVFFSQNSKVTTSLNEKFSNKKNESTSSYDEDDDFRNEFLNVFSNKRKNSFEDNLLFLYSNQSKLNDTQASTIINSIRRTYQSQSQSQSPLLLGLVEKKEEEWFIL